MKEITLRLADNVAATLEKDAKEKGLTSEELIKYILGEHAQCTLGLSPPVRVMKEMFKALDEGMASTTKNMLKYRARANVLSCKRCTMKLSEKDVEDGKCGACGAPLDIALQGDKDNEDSK